MSLSPPQQTKFKKGRKYQQGMTKIQVPSGWKKRILSTRLQFNIAF